MTTCKTCNCPLMVLTQERRTTCARCFEAAQAKKVYRAPKVTAPPKKKKDRSIEEFMNGGERAQVATTLFDRS